MAALRFVLLFALCVGVLSKIDRLEADIEGAFIAAVYLRLSQCFKWSLCSRTSNWSAMTAGSANTT